MSWWLSRGWEGGPEPEAGGVPRDLQEPLLITSISEIMDDPSTALRLTFEPGHSNLFVTRVSSSDESCLL